MRLFMLIPILIYFCIDTVMAADQKDDKLRSLAEKELTVKSRTSPPKTAVTQPVESIHLVVKNTELQAKEDRQRPAIAIAFSNQRFEGFSRLTNNERIDLQQVGSMPLFSLDFSWRWARKDSQFGFAAGPYLAYGIQKYSARTQSQYEYQDIKLNDFQAGVKTQLEYSFGNSLAWVITAGALGANRNLTQSHQNTSANWSTEGTFWQGFFSIRRQIYGSIAAEALYFLPQEKISQNELPLDKQSRVAFGLSASFK